MSLERHTDPATLMIWMQSSHGTWNCLLGYVVISLGWLLLSLWCFLLGNSMQPWYLLSSYVCLSICLSICMSQFGIVSKRLDKPSWFGMEAAFHVSNTVFLVLSGNSDTSKIKGTSLWTLSRTLHLENFATASRSYCHEKSTVVEFANHMYDSRRIVAVYCTSVSCNALTLLLWLLLNMFYNLFLQLCSSWQDFNWLMVSHCSLW